MIFMMKKPIKKKITKSPKKNHQDHQEISPNHNFDEDDGLNG